MTKQTYTCPELEALEREIELAKAVVTRSKAQRTGSTITEIEQSDWLEAAVQRLEAIKAEAQAQPKRIKAKATAKSRKPERKTIRATAKAKHIEAPAQIVENTETGYTQAEEQETEYKSTTFNLNDFAQYMYGGGIEEMNICAAYAENYEDLRKNEKHRYAIDEIFSGAMMSFIEKISAAAYILTNE